MKDRPENDYDAAADFTVKMEKLAKASENIPIVKFGRALERARARHGAPPPAPKSLSIESAAMPVLKEPAQITLAEGLTLLERHLPTEEAKTRLREAFIRKVFLQSPSYAFEYDEADIDWTTGSVKIPRMKDRFRPTFRRADFDRYFFEEQKVQPTKSGRDRKLLHELMLRLQDISRPGVTSVLSGHDNEMAIEGYTSEQINLHLSLLAQMGYVDLARSQPTIGVALKGLTQEGYDFLERNRDGFIVHGHDEAALLKDATTVDTNSSPQPKEMLTLKPTFMGMSLDLKELFRRAKAWWKHNK